MDKPSFDPWSLFRDERGSISISRVQQVGALLLIMGGEIASLIVNQRFAEIPVELLAWAGLGTLQYLGAKGMARLSPEREKPSG